MKILWIVNILFPEAADILFQGKSSITGSGGWLVASASAIADDVSLVVATVSSHVHQLERLQGEKIVYYVLPCKNERKYCRLHEKMWKEIVETEQPDLTHIHGTEFSHGLAFLNANSEIKTLVSMQGVMAAIGKYYLAGLTAKDILLNTTLFDLFYAGALFRQRRNYLSHASNIEAKLIAKADYVIGRTSFDKAWVLSVNPQANYLECNESLRDGFYSGRWCYDNCKPHSIFLSQGHYSIKGLHQVLKMLPLLLVKYPDVKVYVAGRDFLNPGTLKEKMMTTTYAKYIRRLINKKNLSSHVEFLGSLDAEQMKQAYLQCNVFLCPSSVENSPNSLGEAQLLGVPCVASFVGGIPDFIPDERCGKMYRFEDLPTMVQCVSNVFESSVNFDNSFMIKTARSRHDSSTNRNKLLEIYKSVL